MAESTAPPRVIFFTFPHYAAHDREPSTVFLVKIKFASVKPPEKVLPDFCQLSGIVWKLRARSSVG